ncbi:hypothetical protein EJ02DRAFT_135920 [Clathrospora elynae]|uniref:Ig-like domain-containing protein n=1 Tax=Clathrospora elynae TaxID=706981 RepID=A0A6A5S3N3_9PLEO|nr:hypothetical protein EJ02DRAFT_135920 [Clathrospora elynae]
MPTSFPAILFSLVLSFLNLQSVKSRAYFRMTQSHVATLYCDQLHDEGLANSSHESSLSLFDVYSHLNIVLTCYASNKRSNSREWSKSSSRSVSYAESEPGMGREQAGTEEAAE